mmetsp:Transcript_17600/g.26717  ORF Transcript_17600/g.26717 Transcript_17600/m.26717 type:complete len:175 (-) Transcript_17600:20-544(-)
MRYLLLLFFLSAPYCNGFLLPRVSHLSKIDPIFSSTESSVELSSSEEAAKGFFEEINETGYDFRTIVIGAGGAILESTQPLGPTLKTNRSAKSGQIFLTMASVDQSFEFHLKLQMIGKVALIERELPEKTTRLIRIMNRDEESMSTLILSNSSEEASSWFKGMIDKYGSEIDFS